MKRSGSTKRRFFLLLLFIFLLGFSLSLLFNRFVNQEKIVIISPLSSLSKLSVLGTKSSDFLKTVFENELKNTDGVFGIVIKNLKTGEAYYLNEHITFETGSLYKLWVMATLYDRLNRGEIKKEDILEEEISNLNEKFKIASDSAEKTEGTIKMSVSDALEQMISVSDNYAALLLTAKIRLFNVSAFLKNSSFNESKVGIKGELPTTTASDIALFYEKLYRGQLANQESTKEMLNFLKNQRLNNKLPWYLPRGTIMVHKTGELEQFNHDTGIVYTPSGDYIIVVLGESKDRFGTEEKIAKISKLVYDYFESKK